MTQTKQLFLNEPKQIMKSNFFHHLSILFLVDKKTGNKSFQVSYFQFYFPANASKIFFRYYSSSASKDYDPLVGFLQSFCIKGDYSKVVPDE